MAEYKTTFNYLLSHKVMPDMIFRDLELFYNTILASPDNMQIFMKNCVKIASDIADQYPEIEPALIKGFDTIEGFSMRPFGDNVERGVISILIPKCEEVCDCLAVAVPFIQEKARYFTCELSSNPVSGEYFYILGEWTPEGDGYKHSNYGKFDASTIEGFPNKVIEVISGNI